MSMTAKEFWTLVHGMGFGALFLLGFAGGLAGLWSLRADLVTAKGISERMTRLKTGIWLMTIAAWGTVLTGTWIVYPWYRARPPEGADLNLYPRYFLLNDPSLAQWHTFGMEWKEHIAWIAPILVTAVLFGVLYFDESLAERPKERRILMTLYVLSFVTAGVAGLFGALITKAAPIL